MRIVKWQYKLLYVVAGYLLGVIPFRLLPTQGMGLNMVVGNVFDLALFIVGARIFRGRSEDIGAPRAWWRMTSKRPLSKRLGILFSVLSVATAANAIFFAVGKHSAISEATGQFASAATYVVLAFLYLNCAVRLHRVSRLETDPSVGVSAAAEKQMSSAQPEQPEQPERPG